MNLTVAITGASGAILCRELLCALEADERVEHVDFVASENSLRVMAEELGVSGRTGLLEKLLGTASKKIKQHGDSDIGASIASGNYPSGGMVILPCSMGDAGYDRERACELADHAGCGCDAEGAQAAVTVRPRDAAQSHSPAQHDARERCGSGDLSCDAGVL